MGETTGIAWTDSTFNPWIGCQRVSPGCVNCYAEAQDHRWRPGNERWGPTAERTRTGPGNWRKVLQWDERATKLGIRHRVFCSSLADVFENRAELAPWRADLFGYIVSTKMLDWQLLTKRPENLAAMWPYGRHPVGLPLSNVWLGTTVEDQQRANERVPHLLSAPAVVHFLSCEPLLGPIDLRAAGAFTPGRWGAIRWVIVGGESGPKARSFHLDWARDIIEQCKAAGVKVFVKQMGDNAVASGRDQLSLLAMKAHHGADPSEWPTDLRVQEFPRATF